MARSLTTKTGQPTSITVSSATGFDAGDLIYYRNGDFGRVADNAVSTAPFANTTPDPTFLVAGYSGLETVTQLNGGSTNINSALLTNGNIVQVFCANNAYTGLTNGRYYFQIITTSGTVVVSPTILSTTYYTNTNGLGTVGVIALTGGGFVAYWQGNTGGTVNSLVYGVWTNTGTVTTAATQDTTVIFGNTNQSTVRAVALPNGGFVIAGVNNSSTTVQHRIYNSVGTASYAWTASTAPNPNSTDARYGLGIAVRSNNEFIIVYNSSSSNLYPNYYITSETNTAVASGEVSTGICSFASTYACDAAVMSDGTTFAIAFLTTAGGNQYNQAVYRKIPTGNTLGSDVVLPYASVNWNRNDAQSYNLSAKGLSGNKLMVSWSNAAYNICYAVTSSDDKVLTGNFPQVFNGTVFNGNYRTGFSIIEVSGYIFLFYSVFSENGGGYSTISNIRLDSTTLNMLPTSASVPQTTIAGNGDVSGYVLSGSTPSVAKFTSSASGSITDVTERLAATPTVVPNPYALTQRAVYTTSAALPNGGFVIVSKIDIQPYSVVANIYSPQYNLIKSVLVTDASENLADGPTVAVATLTSGKFVVIWSLQNNSQLFGTIFSGSGGILSQFITPNAYYASSSPYNFAACGIKNDRFVLTGTVGGNQVQYLVYDSSGNVLAGPTTAQTLTGATCHNIAPTPYGFMLGFGSNTGPNVTFRHIYEYATNTFVNMQTYSASTNGYAPNAGRVQMAPQATGCTVVWPRTDNNGQGSNFFYYGINNSALAGTGTGAMGDCNNGYRWSMCTTSSGGVAYAFVSGSAVLRVGYLACNLITPNNTIYHEASQYIDIPTSVYSGYVASLTISPLANDWVLVTWVNAESTPMYSVVKPKNTQKAVALISGTTQSSGQGIAPGTTGNGVTGYVFQGVATTTAPAGGTGEVQTVGTALLNSNYSASVSAQAFDHNTPNGSGIAGNKGTIVGRTVNLQGVS